MKPPEMDTDRKTLIADAAIALLGSAGAKALTHRAVDTQAGLPEGSTSAHCRTRQELLTLTLKRHAWLDLQDLQADAQQMAQPGFTQAQFLGLLMARLADWLSPAKREHLVARFQLILMAACDPELALTMGAQRQQFLQATTAALKRLGRRDAAQVAPRLVAVFDGILLDHIHTQGAPLVSPAQRQALLAMCLGEIKAG
jgi:DNA-binding transcriptional regulator YbjK